MSLLENLLTPETIERLGWMLVHILWQAAAVAVLLAVFLRLLRNTSANVRYGLACAALALMVALPIVTMRLMKTPGPAAEAGPPSVIVTLSSEATAPAIPALVETTGEMPAVAQLPGPLPTADMTVHVPLQERIVSTLEPALPYVVLGWLAGILGLSAWHLGGWAQLQRLRRRMVRQVGRPLQQRLEELSIRLGVRRAVGLLESALIEVPTVVGWLRPVILLPASALTGLRPEQLEAILAHELAHIRRYDYLVNIVQTVVEILGFYHPAVWWVSRRIRIERENCCDDLAVHVCGSSLQYARALACMEEIRHSAGDLAMAATGGSLVARIARLLGRPAVDDRRFAWLPGLVALLLVVGISIPAALVLGTPQPPQTVEPTTVAADQSATEPNAAPSKAESASSDVPAAQVLLEFKIVKVLDEARVDREMLIQIANALGIVLPAQKPDQSSRTLDLTVGEVFRKYILPQPLSEQASEAVMRLLQSQGSTIVRSAPRVLTRDSEQALVQIINLLSLPGSDPSAESETVACGTTVNVTPHVLDANWVNLEMMAEVSDPSGFGSNQPTVFRTSAETSVTAQNDRYLVWAAVAPTAAPAGQEADRRSVYIMVKPHINLPPQGLANAPDERRPDGTLPRQMLLDVRTVTMDSGALESLGVQWSHPTGGQSASVRTGYAADRTFTDALLTTLDRLQANHQATISNQQILARELHPSQIKMLREEWSTNAQPHKTETGMIVKVRPHVANDSTILLDLTIDSTRRLPTPPGSNLPVQSAQTCQTTIALKDGGTVAVGGLSTTEAQGQPGQETVIFVTTHLIDDANETPAPARPAADPAPRTPPVPALTPEQVASMQREYVNSDPVVNELSKSIATLERSLVAQQTLVKENHPKLTQEQVVLDTLKRRLEAKRQELEKEFDDAVAKAKEMAGSNLRTRFATGFSPEESVLWWREHVNSDALVSELSKSIVAVEGDLATQQVLTKEDHPKLAQEQMTLDNLKKKLEARRQELNRTGRNTGRHQEATITAAFTKTNLQHVLAEIAERTGAKVILDATVKTTPVTADLVQASPETALQQVLKNTPYTFRDIGDGYSVFRPQTFTFAGADLVKALRDLSASAEVPIGIDPNVREDVYVRFEDAPLEEALQLMLAGKPYVFKKTPHYILVHRLRETVETRRIRLNYTQPGRVKAMLSPVFAPYIQAEQPKAH